MYELQTVKHFNGHWWISGHFMDNGLLWIQQIGVQGLTVLSLISCYTGPLYCTVWLI